jgi:hypothetical protein
MRECASKCVSVNEGVRYCVCVCEYVHMLVSERVSLYFCVNLFYFNLKTFIIFFVIIEYFQSIHPEYILLLQFPEYQSIYL